MVEYIERDAALEIVKRTSGDYVAAFAEIRKIPAADVVPVAHGWWNADETCSMCGEKSTEGLDATKWNYWLPNYCPNCGAKMDGGVKNA